MILVVILVVMVILASSAGLRDESGYDLNGSLEIGDQMIILSRDDSSKLDIVSIVYCNPYLILSLIMVIVGVILKLVI